MRIVETTLLLVPLLGFALPVCLYLGLLTLAAPFGARRRARRADPRHRFGVLVPAHDEELLLGRLLESLRQVAYPANLVDVCVVADNCSDDTAAIARARGARVFERQNREQLGKGYALQWLLDELAASGCTYDAYVVLDADSTVSPNFLEAFNDRLSAGAAVVQAYYTVLPLRGTRSESLREAALALVHYLRPAAKMALGASCGLKGNGMAFSRAVLDRYGWPAAGLAEDVEFHLELVRAGIHVEFAPEAVVRAEMPASLAASESQNLRWEAGRLATLRRQALPLLVNGLRRRDLAACDAAIEQCVPPLSIPVAMAGLCLIAGLALQLQAVWITALVLLVALALHLVSGLLLARVSGRVYRSLLHLPVYIAWKVALYARALAGRRQRAWVRTEREGLSGER